MCNPFLLSILHSLSLSVILYSPSFISVPCQTAIFLFWKSLNKSCPCLTTLSFPRQGLILFSSLLRTLPDERENVLSHLSGEKRREGKVLRVFSDSTLTRHKVGRHSTIPEVKFQEPKIQIPESSVFSVQLFSQDGMILKELPSAFTGNLHRGKART